MPAKFLKYKRPLLFIFGYYVIIISVLFLPQIPTTSASLEFVGTEQTLGQAPLPALAKGDASPAVYYISNGSKHLIPTAKIFLSYGSHWEEVQPVDQTTLDSVPEFVYIKLSTGLSVYKLEANSKRLITPTAFEILNPDPLEILSVNKTEFNFYKNGIKLDTEEATNIAGEKKSTLESEQVSQTLSFQQPEACVENEQAGGKAGCQFYDAVTKKDVGLCSQITDMKWKSLCLSNFTPTGTDTLEYCKTLPAGDDRDNCVSHLAQRTNSNFLCDEVLSATIKTQCQVSLGIANKNISACDSQASGDTKDQCYYVYASVNSDQSACAKISSPAYLEACNKFVAKP